MISPTQRSEIRLVLPYPPSDNHYYQHGRGKIWIGEKGKSYRKCVGQILQMHRIKTITDQVCLEVIVNPPDKRIRDISNLCKCLFDALQHGGLYENDYQIARFSMVRSEIVKGGMIMVTIGG